jgi:hypothetical protein
VSMDLQLDSLVTVNPCLMTLVPSDEFDLVPSAKVYVGVEVGTEPIAKEL